MQCSHASRVCPRIACLSLALAFGGACAWRETDAEADAARTAAESSDTCGRVDAGNGTERELDSAARHPLTVMTWNLEWFQDPGKGPQSDTRQYAVARAVLASSGAALIALEEIASEAAFDRLLTDLKGYNGVLSGYDWTQKTALLWSERDFELHSARALHGLDDAGRPPLRVVLTHKPDGHAWLVVVVHAKAQADDASHAQRVRFAAGLAAQLMAEEEPPTTRILLGDLNDMLEGSITSGMSTPYAAFVDDPAYITPTRALNGGQVQELSYAWGATVDHILVSRDLAPQIAADSVNVLRDELLARYPDFIDEVSDHFPVTLTLRP